LEARVEILSGGKDEALSEMRNVLKGTRFPALLAKIHLYLPFASADLMTENQTLRNMLKGLATFIGDGLGGVLPKLNWDVNDFDAWVNKGETDTAWEGYQARKKQMQQTQGEGAVAGTSSLPGMSGQKRPADDTSLAGQSKKSRPDDGDRRASNGFNSLLSPMPSSSNIYPPDSRGMDRPMFPDMMRGSAGSAMFGGSPPPSSGSQLPYGSVPGNLENYQTQYLGGMTMPPLNQPLHQQPPYDTPSGSSTQARSTPLSGTVPSDDPEALDDDPNKSEAYKLIQ
jgi:hypothetical protein